LNFHKVALPPGLYFVGVPIGTARDITLRALDILASADLLAAEDTRSLKHLMTIHGVPRDDRQIMALHDHSGATVVEGLVATVGEGRSVAYASEAGMPLISDPGYDLGLAMRRAGHLVTCAPGPSAVSTALVLAGLPTDAFHFAGFLPSTKAARRKALERLRDIEATLVLYESPRRLVALLGDAAEVFGDRDTAVCRELTKKFEEVRRGTPAELRAHFDKSGAKGEIVVLFDRSRSEKISEVPLEQDLRSALASRSLRDAVDLVATVHGLPRRQVYQLALKYSKG
jgi:16S rRNA (cytidine1402-2'-O)-methyltransferase